MMLTGGLALALAMNWLLAELSGRKGLPKLALLLIGGFALSETASALLHPPARIAVYAVLDCIGFMLTLIVIYSHSSARHLRGVFIPTYGLMLAGHILLLSHIRVPMYFYYLTLNVLTAAQIVSCIVAGGAACVGMVRESDDRFGVLGLRRLRHR